MALSPSERFQSPINYNTTSVIQFLDEKLMYDINDVPDITVSTQLRLTVEDCEQIVTKYKEAGWYTVEYSISEYTYRFRFFSSLDTWEVSACSSTFKENS